MKVVIFGATGMVGRGALLSHPKLREVLHADFFDFSGVQSQFAGLDACFFCLGVSSVGMAESKYQHLTYDLTLAAATALASATSSLTFCYISGEGTDSTERGRVAWARIKGRTENALLRLPFKAAFMFRPGYIQPLKGIRSKTWWYQALYTAFGMLYPLLRRLAPRSVTTTVNLGRALIQVAASGYTKQILRSDDINWLAES
jgi:uncharacterized protein YbjT (DUF2867 family)